MKITENVKFCKLHLRHPRLYNNQIAGADVLIKSVAPGLRYKTADALSLFPGSVRSGRGIEAMNTFKQILFTLVAVAAFSFAASAQGGGQQRPPKDPKPVPAKPKPSPPKDEKPKKPGMSYFVALPPESEYSK